METYFIVTDLFLTNITWINNDWYWPMIEESILKIIFFFRNYYSIITAPWPMTWDNEWKICPSSKWNYFFLFRNYYQLQHHFSTLTNDWYNEAWIIDISILKMIFFFILKLLQHHSSAFTNDWYDEWKICPSSKWNYFFLFRNYYSIISAPWPMTDIMKHE